jgi:hypothetical protein
MGRIWGNSDRLVLPVEAPQTLAIAGTALRKKEPAKNGLAQFEGWSLLNRHDESALVAPKAIEVRHFSFALEAVRDLLEPVVHRGS